MAPAARPAGGWGRPRRARWSRGCRRRWTGCSISAASRTAGLHVIAENEEGTAERAHEPDSARPLSARPCRARGRRSAGSGRRGCPGWKSLPVRRPRVVGRRQVGGPADQLRDLRGRACGMHLAGGRAGGDRPCRRPPAEPAGSRRARRDSSAASRRARRRAASHSASPRAPLERPRGSAPTLRVGHDEELSSGRSPASRLVCACCSGAAGVGVGARVLLAGAVADGRLDWISVGWPSWRWRGIAARWRRDRCRLRPTARASRALRSARARPR